MKASQAISLLLASLAGTASADSQVVAIHGSGTTNPSKCIWHVMSLFEERSRVKTHLTYRAVGSSTGQLEFLGADNAGTVKDVDGVDLELTSHVPYNDFGAGDIPIPTEAYDKLNSAAGHENSEIVHLPFAMSSVSFFHNIAGVPDGEGGIKLSPCLLARIFMGKIRNWDDSEILEENKDLEGVLSGPIFVAHRVEGSSSTKSITKVCRCRVTT
jgi:ABC-type phosphate transport system substrate-binding protein